MNSAPQACFPAVGTKNVIAAGTISCNDNIFFSDSRAGKNRYICIFKAKAVQRARAAIPAAGGTFTKHFALFYSFYTIQRKIPEKIISPFLIYNITAAANMRSNGNANIFRFCRKILYCQFHRFFNNSSSFPSRMNHSKKFRDRIKKKQRHTVCNSNHGH